MKSLSIFRGIIVIGRKKMKMAVLWDMEIAD